MTDLRRTIIILMALACVVDIVGVIHCHVNYSYDGSWYPYRTSYSIIFPIVLSLTGFLLLEQLLITDGTLAPLNRLRIVYAFSAALALLIFGIGAVVMIARSYNSHYHSSYHNAIVAAIISFIGAAIYIGEAIIRNRKGRII